MTVLTPTQRILAKAMTERQLQTHIIAAVGFPDLVLVDRAQRRVLALECKKQGKLPTAAQIAWIEALGAVAGISARVVYPADWISGEVIAMLTDGSGVLGEKEGR